MSTLSYIYGLIDPNDNQVRYIGKTINPAQRLSRHLNRKNGSHLSNWIQSLIQRKQQPLLKVLFTTTPQRENEMEKAAIRHYKQFSKLTNATEGGDGWRNDSCQTLQQLKVKRAENAKKKWTAEKREWFGLIMRARWKEGRFGNVSKAARKRMLSETNPRKTKKLN